MERRVYAERVPKGMIHFEVPIIIVRYGGNVCGLAMHPGIMVLEDNVERVPGAALVYLTMTRFHHDNAEVGFVIGGYAVYASWWRKGAPVQYQRRAYGSSEGWPTQVDPRKQLRFVGFRKPSWRGWRE